jgi:DNA-binding MarR family transcriptional regulator
VDNFVTAILGASWVLVGLSTRSVTQVDENLTLTQFRTLAVLARHSTMNLQGLADELQVNASTAMRMVDRLVAGNLVSRQENPASRREVILSLTPDGERIVEQVMARRRDELRRIVRKMRQEERQGLITALQSFASLGGNDGRANPGALGW